MDDPFKIRQLSQSTGAEILGFDFGNAANEEQTRLWHRALDQFQLLVFREVDLDPETQVAFLETLGATLIENETGRAYQFVSNTHEEGILGDESFAFHSDHAFMPDPIDFIALYAVEIPSAGTQTRFTNALAAARDLPEDRRADLAPLRARHIIDPAAKSADIPVRRPRLSDDLPHAYHPILSEHPRLREKILYVSEQQTDRIEDLTEEQSTELIESLFIHLYSPRYAYQHEWQKGDLVIWDNRALQHARDAVAPGLSRTLRRVSVGGTSVYDFFKQHDKWEFS
jgi:taurine dioxygenase